MLEPPLQKDLDSILLLYEFYSCFWWLRNTFSSDQNQTPRYPQIFCWVTHSDISTNDLFAYGQLWQASSKMILIDADRRWIFDVFCVKAARLRAICWIICIIWIHSYFAVSFFSRGSRFMCIRTEISNFAAGRPHGLWLASAERSKILGCSEHTAGYLVIPPCLFRTQWLLYHVISRLLRSVETVSESDLYTPGQTHSSGYWKNTIVGHFRNRLIGGTYIPFFKGQFFRPKFQGISPQNMALYGTVPSF